MQLTKKNKSVIITDKSPHLEIFMIIQKSNFGSVHVIRSGIHDGKYCFGDHIHQFAELVWVLDGEIEMTVNGRTELAKKGDFTVISPFAIHSFYTPEYSKIHIAVISDSFIVDRITPDELYRERQSAVFTPSDELCDFLDKKGYIELCLSQLGKRDDNNYLHSISSLIYLIYTEYFNTVPAQIGFSSKNALSSILIYMTEHFTEDLTLENVGAALGYSPKYVSNCVASLPGFNFRRLVNSLRIEYAKNLLINQTHLTVLDVAMRCGFSNERSFHRAFLDIVGTTPAVYRRTKTSLNNK